MRLSYCHDSGSGVAADLRPCKSPAISGETRILPKLFYRHALCQVARLVDIGALDDRDMVGEELDRDRIEQRGDKRIAMRHGYTKSKPIGKPGDAGSVGN